MVSSHLRRLVVHASRVISKCVLVRSRSACHAIALLLSSSVRSHLIFIRPLSHVIFIRPTQSIFQYSFFVYILLPIISNILVCAILLTYSAITSGDKTCVTFCLARHCCRFIDIEYNVDLREHHMRPLWTQLLVLVALASAYSICLVYLWKCQVSKLDSPLLDIQLLVYTR